MEGNIIADGVMASCYASADHELAHLTVKPIIWFPEIFQWIFNDGSGFSVYAKIAADLGKWLLPN